jgi:hypothetical protein
MNRWRSSSSHAVHSRLYGTRRIITVHTRSRRWSFCWDTWIQSKALYTHVTIMLLSTSRSSKRSVYFRLCIFNTIVLLPNVASLLPLSFDQQKNIWWIVQIRKRLIMPFYQNLFYCSPLKSQQTSLHYFSNVFSRSCFVDVLKQAAYHYILQIQSQLYTRVHFLGFR